MVVAGEPSGDMLAAELVRALRPALTARDSRATDDAQPLWTPLAPRFFGAGGPRLAAAGVELAVDLTAHAVFGLSEVVRHLAKFRRLLQQLTRLAEVRQPELVVLVDNAGFNRRLAAILRRRVRRRRRSFCNWDPRIVYYVSPQVWASRPGRAHQLARDIDLLLSIFPFEKAWYAEHTPGFRVEFVGHPLVERYGPRRISGDERAPSADPPLVLLLPGSRAQEVRRHLPVMVAATRILQARQPVRARLVLPNDGLLALTRQCVAALPGLETCVGQLDQSLSEAQLALACSGTVTLECAFFGVPAVVVYRVAWPTYWAARSVVRVEHIAMPNLLAGERLYPELIQDAVTPQNLAAAAHRLLSDPERRRTVRARLADVVASLGTPGAGQRAARAILDVMDRRGPCLRASLGAE